MKDLILEDFPDDLYDELCRRAEKNGRTASGEAIILLSATFLDEFTTQIATHSENSDLER